MSPVLRFQWLLSLLVWLALPLLPAIAAMPAIRGRLTSREGVFPHRCGVLVRVGCLPHRSAPLLLLLLAMTAIALLLAIEAQRASQLRMRTSACSIQTMTGLRTFNPKVVGSSPTGGTAAFTLAPAFRRLRVTIPSHAPPCSATLKGAARQGRNRTEGLHTGSATAPESTRALHKTR